jgi:hypothetical protein
MKPLSKHIQETFNNESSKEVFVEKPVDEDSASFMRASSTKECDIMKGTISNEKQEGK